MTQLGTYLVAGIALLLAIGLIGLLILLAKRVQRVQVIVNPLKSKLFYNSIIRFLIQAYLKFCEIGCLSLLNFSFNSPSQTGSSIAGIFIFVFVIVFPQAVFYLMQKHRLNLENDAIKTKFGSAYLNIETSKDYAYWLTTIFLVRRLLLVFAAIFMQDTPSIQLVILNVSSLLIMIFVIKVKPLSSAYLNRIEIFNEAMFLICSCSIIAFTDYGPHSEVLLYKDPSEEEKLMRDSVGWSYIATACLVIAISMGGLILITLHALFSKM